MPWHGLLIVFAFALALPLQAAPRPGPKSPKHTQPVGVTPGQWIITWNSTDAPTRLDGNGGYSCVWKGTAYMGRWVWTPRTRLLHISEVSVEDEDQEWIHWTIRLDSNLTGKAESNGWKVKLHHSVSTKPDS